MKRSELVGDSWTKILAWFARHAPDQIDGFRAPATEPDLRAVEEAMGVRLPADQRAWWRLADGTDEERLIELVPMAFRPLSTGRARKFHRGIVDLAPKVPELPEWMAEPAGSPTYGTWLPQWLPVARDFGGDFLFLDLRRGPRFGCVGIHRNDDWQYDGPDWPNVAAMLAEVAGALTGGTEFDRWHAGVEDGCLTWLMD
ncbi:SMI1/KNR4 family protein [Actinoplanes couchii]|uniref:Knr4/Smi1-like domain-containing protein n=1 Tax=Actinoplanes couchii TaxID=403638 RepID=A0ABQ3XPD6_9ACTN|nr:SMI1/KNR4 family protein [Actinoplanes couchii]MDR6315853.1 cell wall assembly regulator SMI1 [Actinoplanes couchii]GID60351.1 hypothetical protein Aco03nite_087550 [Actinoplanes couchii]